MRTALFLAAVLGCSKPAVPPAPAVKAPPPAAVPLDSSVQAGEYAITGRTMTDHCERALILAAKEITIDIEARLLRADVVSRNYALELRGDELVATGHFDPIEECGTHQFIEVWRLRPHGPSTLKGQLTTYYRDAPTRDCLRACKFVTEIKAERKP